jgi:hypothetical protein
VRGCARAHVGLLETGVDFACRLGKLAPCRHLGGASAGRPVDLAGDDDHHAAVIVGFEQSERGHELNTAGIAAAGQQSAEVSAAA